MLLVHEQNFAPLCEKLLHGLVTLESGTLVALEGEKVDVQWRSNGELRDKGSKAWRKDLEEERVYPSAGDFQQLHTLFFFFAHLGTFFSQCLEGLF